ncbi:hypothetical protein VNO77_02633 [Canavalia gladiata]|uniref:Uncharacterized protein n=1 Tax=Canavalia gladiata TaxID=3824 RepID=A0AAN9MTA2_CANGL
MDMRKAVLSTLARLNSLCHMLCFVLDALSYKKKLLTLQVVGCEKSIEEEKRAREKIKQKLKKTGFQVSTFLNHFVLSLLVEPSVFNCQVRPEKGMASNTGSFFARINCEICYDSGLGLVDLFCFLEEEESAAMAVCCLQ